jgi:osmotically-inducible protein OsmY
MRQLTLLLSLCLCLNACAPIVFLAGATTSVMLYERRAFATRVQDYRIREKIEQNIQNCDKIASHSRVQVAVLDGIVLLTGQTGNARLQKLLRQQVPNSSKIQAVFNQVQISKPAAANQRAYDSWLATKVKSEMLTNNGLTATQIKIVVSNNIVYLMGKVSREEASQATNVASQVKGVKKVVKVFEYMQ